MKQLEDLKTDCVIADLSNAMYAPSMPCNPIPFANGLICGCKEYGTDFIQTKEAKRLLWLLNAMAYGQTFNINSINEYNTLK